MRKLYLALIILTTVCSSFRTEASVTTELTELFLRSMSRSAPAAMPVKSAEGVLVAESPAMLRAAKLLGEGASQAEQKKAAELLATVVAYELNARGCTGPMSHLCRSKYLADAIDARVMDVLQKRDDLLLKILAAPKDSTRFLDPSGAPMLSSSEQRALMDELALYARSSVAASRKEGTLSGFARKFVEGFKGVGGVDVEYDARDHLATLTFTLGKHKGKVAKLDMKKLFDRSRYLLAGGGLASLGYAHQKPEKKPPAGATPGEASRPSSAASAVDPKATARVNLLESLDQYDRDSLYTEAEALYFAERARKLQKRLAKTGS